MVTPAPSRTDPCPLAVAAQAEPLLAAIADPEALESLGEELLDSRRWRDLAGSPTPSPAKRGALDAPSSLLDKAESLLGRSFRAAPMD